MPKLAAKPNYFLTSPPKAFGADPPTNLVGQGRLQLFHDLEGGALAVARSRAGKKRANCVNGLAIAADDSANVALAQLHFKDGHFAARNFREHHLVRVLDELADDKLEKLPHAGLKIRSINFATVIDCRYRAGASGAVVDVSTVAGALAASFLFFLIKLRTVSDG